MQACYRFLRSLSYSALALGALSACGAPAPDRPALVAQGASVPAGWPSPRPGAATLPEIQAMRFSSLDVKLGQDWTGEIVATEDTSDVELATNLYWIHVPRTAPGRFAFRLHVYDLPAFLIRGYDLHVIAHGPNGEETQTTVPFRIRGRGEG
jgi:hypothetical protein